MLALVRLQAENAFCLDRKDLEYCLSIPCGTWPKVQDLLGTRHASDCVRKALTYLLDQHATIYHNNQAMRIIRAEAKTSKDVALKISLHLQKRGEAVNYLHLGDLVLQNSGSLEWHENYDTPAEFRDLISPELRQKLAWPTSLQALGQACFVSDLRGIVDQILISKMPKLWPGTWLCSTPELYDEAKHMALFLELASGRSEGEASLSMITLENSQGNRDTLCQELSTSYADMLRQLSEKLSMLSPNDAKLSKKLASLQEEFDGIYQQAFDLQDSLQIDFAEDFQDLLSTCSASLAQLSQGVN